MHTSLLYFSALAGLVTASTCCNSFPGNDVPIETRSIAEIYAAAQKESGTLKVAYGGDEIKQGAGLIEAFQASFPAIKFNLTVDLSKYHSARVNRDYQRGEKYADVVVLQTLQDFDIWKAQGRLIPYKPPTWNQIFSEVKDPAGAWLPAHIASFGAFVWNANKTGSATIPTSYKDVLAPEWKSKLVLCYPNDDDAINFLFSGIVQKYGWGWFEALLEQDVQWVRGTETPSEIILGNSSRSLSFSTTVDAGLNSSLPASDPFMSWAQASAILAGTDMPESAKLFIAFVYGVAFQEAINESGGYSILNGVGSPVWNVTNTDASGYHRFMINRESVEAWRFQFESYLGTAQGISPLIDDIN